MEIDDRSYILKQIAKELHEMNKKLDRLGQASIFKEKSEVTNRTEAIMPTYTYIDDCPSKQPTDD